MLKLTSSAIQLPRNLPGIGSRSTRNTLDWRSHARKRHSLFLDAPARPAQPLNQQNTRGRIAHQTLRGFLFGPCSHNDSIVVCCCCCCYCSAVGRGMKLRLSVPCRLCLALLGLAWLGIDEWCGGRDQASDQDSDQISDPAGWAEQSIAEQSNN